tara:strand:- start:4749 stop:5291 length:543 start_codon:yes stop_codon:yes gene_type:complete
MKTENLERRLQSFADQVVKDSRAILQNKKGSTALGNSIRAVVSSDPNGFSVKFYMEDYGTFVDKGVSGNKNPISYADGTRMKSSPYKYTTKGPPIDILSKWIKKKGIKPKGLGRGRSKKTGQFLSGFAYLISKKIKREGIKSLSFFSRPLGINYKELQETLLTEFQKDVSTYITTFTKHK